MGIYHSPNCTFLLSNRLSFIMTGGSLFLYVKSRIPVAIRDFTWINKGDIIFDHFDCCLWIMTVMVSIVTCGALMVRCLYGDGDDDEEDNVLVVALLATNLYNIHLTLCKCDGGLSRTLHDLYRWIEVSEKNILKMLH